MNKQTSDMEIMEAIKALSEHVDERFDKMEDSMNKRFDQVWDELNFHRTWLERIEANIVTKSQFNSLVSILRRNKTISEYDAEHAINLSVL
jgi:arginyl-tRNA synthetase